MGIHDDDVARVRETADLVQLVSEHTQIKRSGRQWMALCPFHGEKSPSFSVNAEKGVYHCFGCGKSGDAISFVQELEGLDFVGALERLAAKTGITLRYTNENEGESRSRRKRLSAAVDKAADFYHQRLLTGSDAGGARGYLRSRGYGGDIVRQYRMGWAPDDWDALARHLKLSNDDLFESGLGFVNKANRQQDSFRGRVMFPIVDERGDAVGFGGRILPGTEGSKYKNTSSDAIIYDKSRVLYGLHQHRVDIVNNREAIICEGYTDVIGFAEADLARAVATCGTALTEQHIKVLKRFSADRLVLAFDADAAGLAAADRVYEWEIEFDLEVVVADLRPGADPADLAREDPVELKRAITEAVPFLQYRVDRVINGADLRTVEARARTAQAAVALVHEHPNPLIRDQYLFQIADRCRVDIGQLREIAARGAAPRATTRSEPELSTEPERHRATVEDEALLLLLHRPETVSGRLTVNLFADPDHRAVFSVLMADPNIAVASAEVSERAGRLMRRLAVQDSTAIPDDVLAGLANMAARRVAEDLRREARAVDDPQAKQVFSTSIAWLKARQEELWDRDLQAATLSQLLPWLDQHQEERGS